MKKFYISMQRQGRKLLLRPSFHPCLVHF